MLSLEGQQRIGADIAASGSPYLNEIPIRDFLLEQMNQTSKPIEDFCFVSASMTTVLSDAAPGSATISFKDISGF